MTTTQPSDIHPPSRRHLWGPERRRLSSLLIQKALDALPGSRSEDLLPSKPYQAVKRPYGGKFSGKASKSYVPEAPVSERRVGRGKREGSLTPREGYGVGFESEGEGGEGESQEVDGRGEKMFFGQGGSMLFERLPFGVRMQIYGWVLGWKVLHIILRSDPPPLLNQHLQLRQSRMPHLFQQRNPPPPLRCHPIPNPLPKLLHLPPLPRIVVQQLAPLGTHMDGDRIYEVAQTSRGDHHLAEEDSGLESRVEVVGAVDDGGGVGEGKLRGEAEGVENAKVVPAVGFDEETEEDLPFRIVRMKS
ncbi:hypothetical protein DSL72_009335 [Monilinia vaccinii-corymbosi]|uniref:Uncharacterized protein n=1 Tax=Monilinia vaccinii-corymbosi TaxID=61207 RepID=A0A8A3PQW6_9HELO|nr:hypothetical protein DSL72_009335 [Monilinia vaccinii-corymbosi]